MSMSPTVLAAVAAAAKAYAFMRQPARRRGPVSKSQAQKVLRELFGASATISRVHCAGLVGVRVTADGGVLFQTFDMHGDVWRRVVVATLPWARTRARRSA